MTDDREWKETLPKKNMTMREYVTQVMNDPSRSLELKELIKLYGLRRLESLIQTGSMKVEEEVNKE